jgi:hypothetical protein
LVMKHGTREQVAEYHEKFLPEVIDITKYKAAFEQAQPKKFARLPVDFKLIGTIQRFVDPDDKAVVNYARMRGLTERDFWFWKLGVSGNDPLFRRRLIMPSFDADGNLNYFTGRAIDKDRRQKYTNCEVHKSEVIFNEMNIDWSQRLALVEGPFDLMRCRGSNATCLLGSSLPDGPLLHKILEHRPPIVLMLDNDMQDKMQSIAKMLSTCDIEVYIADLTGHKDPGEMMPEETAKVIAEAKRWNWMTYFNRKLLTLTSCSLKI